jgi:hypothetical protein
MSVLRAIVVAVCGFGLSGLAGVAVAQDLEPRAYAAAPVGLNFLVLAGGRSTGDVVVDPSLPVEDVHASVNSLSLGFGTTVNVLGRTGLLVAVVPYVWADATGRVGDETGHASRTGLGDPRLKFSVNLLGGRAVGPREFARAQRRTIAGVSLTMAPGSTTTRSWSTWARTAGRSNRSLASRV